MNVQSCSKLPNNSGEAVSSEPLKPSTTHCFRNIGVVGDTESKIHFATALQNTNNIAPPVTRRPVTNIVTTTPKDAVYTNSGNAPESRNRPLNRESDTKFEQLKAAKIEHRTITASSAKPEPGKTNTLTQFETFQGPPITSIKRAEEIHGKQKAFAGDAFQFLSKLNVDSKSFNIENQRPQIQPVLAIFQQYYRDIVLNQKAITPETLQ